MLNDVEAALRKYVIDICERRDKGQCLSVAEISALSGITKRAKEERTSGKSSKKAMGAIYFSS